MLCRPMPADAEAMYLRDASDPAVTRFLSWPTHRCLEDTRAFVARAAVEWEHWPAGAYLIRSRSTGLLLGSTGLRFERPYRASTGYVLAQDAWGLGYASEALRSMVEIARATGVARLSAMCHTQHRASERVLEKAAFRLEGTLRGYDVFPNLVPHLRADVRCYARMLDSPLPRA